jgi:hypothetical protein
LSSHPDKSEVSIKSEGRAISTLPAFVSALNQRPDGLFFIFHPWKLSGAAGVTMSLVRKEITDRKSTAPGWSIND